MFRDVLHSTFLIPAQPEKVSHLPAVGPSQKVYDVNYSQAVRRMLKYSRVVPRCSTHCNTLEIASLASSRSNRRCHMAEGIFFPCNPLGS